MKVLLRNLIDLRPAHCPGMSVYRRLSAMEGLKNGALIARAAAEGFQVLVTTDRPLKRADPALLRSR